MDKLAGSDVISIAAAYAGAESAISLAKCSRTLHETIMSAHGTWRLLCADRWGDSVPTLSSGANFVRYYAQRTATWQPCPSPLRLIQEEYGSDPWQLLMACALCSRTAGGPVIHGIIRKFFEQYPTPSDVLRADQGELAALLRPLGMNREQTIVRTASGFLHEHGWEQA